MRNELALDDSNGFDGMDISVVGINGALEVEIPYYSNLRFLPFLSNLVSTPSEGLGWKFRALWKRLELTGGPTIDPVGLPPMSMVLYDTFVSTGEDFNAFYFNGVPPMWETEGP